MTPDIAAFLNSFGAEVLFGQVLIQRKDKAFDLRHINNRTAPAETLQVLTVDKLRDLAQFTAGGEFRPLKSAPTLRDGWRAEATDAVQLNLALSGLYPGALPDWFAAKSTNPPITSFRQFTGRQTGIYRVIAKLTDAEASPAIQSCCHLDHCLKRRLWTVEGLSPDAPERKSLIPCLEPCAIMLESARRLAASK